MRNRKIGSGRNMRKKIQLFFITLFLSIVGMQGCENINNDSFSFPYEEEETKENLSQETGTEQTEEPFEIWNHNIPVFTDDEITTQSFERYSELDELGRCGTALACIGENLMPAEERGRIGQIKPSGWHTVKYEFIDGNYLYNRCHLIGYQLAGENANEKNLITGTRYMNVEGMLPYENMVADYVKETKNHVMYRVTPVFEGENLLASGVEMEAYSVEDEGEGISYHVFVYNKQPGIFIDYASGESRIIVREKETEPEAETETAKEYHYVLNNNTMRFHLPSCESVNQMKECNKEYYDGTREQLIENGYLPCGNCKP